VYAYAVEGLEPERREEFDRILNRKPGPALSQREKARREREAVEAAMRVRH
jgi:hypothetical protein